MKKYNKAFTLVELIVVITILAILGTIAFINLQGYSTSARDGKRVSDINNIMKKIGIESSKGTSLSSLITTTKTNLGLTINGNSGSSIQGTANFATLKEDGSKFKDPVTKGDYVFSYSVGGSGTGAYKFNQVSTVNEEENTAVVKGNYYQMQSGDSPSITYNPDSTYFVVDGGVDLPYDINTNNILSNNGCNYLQNNVDILNVSGSNGLLSVIDINYNDLNFPLSMEQWCNDVYGLYWNGGSIVLPEIYTLSKLEYLSLYGNNITSISNQIGNLTGLKILELDNNQLSDLPLEIGQLSLLDNLYLTNNQFTFVPIGVTNLTNLKYLNIGSNQITAIPSQIQNLTSLQTFALTNNQLSNLPSEIGNLNNLEGLYMDSNLFLSIPIGVTNLSSLNTLSLADNQISSIPIQIQNMTLLNYLELTNNQLTILPEEIGNIANLKSIVIQNNLLTSIPSNIVNLNLEGLNLSLNSGLGQLSYNFIFGAASSRTQSDIPNSGQSMTITSLGNGSPISITIN